jgi:hypothetical protein
MDLDRMSRKVFHAADFLSEGIVAQRKAQRIGCAAIAEPPTGPHPGPPIISWRQLPTHFHFSPNFNVLMGLIWANPRPFPKLFTTGFLIELRAVPSPGNARRSHLPQAQNLVNNLATMESNRPTTLHLFHFTNLTNRS